MTTTVGKDLRTAADGEQIAFAVEQGRVLVTHDDDFLKLPADLHHPVIAYAPPGALSLGEAIRWLRLMYEALKPGEMKDRVEFGFGV